MAIPYRTAKFKSANTLVMAIWDPTAKYNSRQYFRLYSIYPLLTIAKRYFEGEFFLMLYVQDYALSDMLLHCAGPTAVD